MPGSLLRLPLLFVKSDPCSDSRLDLRKLATDEDGETALMVTAENGQLQNVRALVLAGAKLDQENAEGKNLNNRHRK